ncbi:MAG: carbamoyltransferase HypF [Acidobacteria bacterium]|nr:carbamoyltransferase HypF [Acidobacteriota bacterium]
MATAAATGARIRLRIRVRGVVQGVGFRPFVCRLARARGLDGFVLNDADGVWIEVEGIEENARGLASQLTTGAPPLASITEVEVEDLVLAGDPGFRVLESGPASSGRAVIPVDAATCDACLRELFDPADRRFRYPFVNCTDCGPRYTIVRETPYDRKKTTMDAFALCGPCLAEYENPLDRRFHAEANACGACGPSLKLIAGRAASPVPGSAALAAAAKLLTAGGIVALKGLGGFHLAVNAHDAGAVERLRSSKRRPSKPFALMARDLDVARTVADVSPEAERTMLSPARPIVLLSRRRQAEMAEGVAPGLSEVGVMLPYTPLHHLLLNDGPPLLVMTSGNLSEEPIARRNDEALEKLGGIADAFLIHDREIHTRTDDSVIRIVAGDPQLIRRSRGFVPEPIRIPVPPASASVLAAGAGLKNTVCLTRGDEAFLSPHIGDLENPEAIRFFEEVTEKLKRLLSVDPAAVAHDLHPDYFSTRWAVASGLPRQGVQHHHAHVAACLAEHGRTETAIGIAFDGTGCGPSGELWGGEILTADLIDFRRAGHLRVLRLPGGEAAIRQPWRAAAGALLDAGEALEALEDVPPDRLHAIRRMLEKNARSPEATGAGRWFDVVAVLCGFLGTTTYEGQAAAELEALAGPDGADPYPFDLLAGDGEGPFEVDLRPMVREIASARRAGAPVRDIASRFHETMARVILESARIVRKNASLETAVFSGGCFQNRTLTERAKLLLESDGFEVLIHRRVPANDGGVSLGQAAVAATRLARRQGRI